MEACKVKSVLRPYIPGMCLEHTVAPEEKLTAAGGTMLSLGINRIAVLLNGNPIGIIRLEDALEKLGLGKVPVS